MRALDSVLVKQQATACGFDLCGVSAAERHPRLLKLADWIADGYAGEMTYLHKSQDERLDPALVLSSARTVISVACVYNSPSAESAANRPVVARYARGDDYHDVLRERLSRLLRWIADEAGVGFEAFSCIDSGPIQERVFAEQAGIGWIGKNTCVINPRLGSWLFLGEIITNAELELDRPAVDQCGTCTRCLDACPTGAFTAPYALDATKCLSYLTIELRGVVSEGLRTAIHDQIFGCDICQDVCPWNRRAAVSDDAAWAPRERLQASRVAELCAMTDVEWRGLLRGSAMRRAGLRRIRRSLAYAASHLSPDEARSALAALAAEPSALEADVADAIAWSRRVVDVDRRG